MNQSASKMTSFPKKQPATESTTALRLQSVAKVAESTRDTIGQIIEKKRLTGEKRPMVGKDQVKRLLEGLPLFPSNDIRDVYDDGRHLRALLAVRGMSEAQIAALPAEQMERLREAYIHLNKTGPADVDLQKYYRLVWGPIVAEQAQEDDESSKGAESPQSWELVSPPLPENLELMPPVIFSEDESDSETEAEVAKGLLSSMSDKVDKMSERLEELRVGCSELEKLRAQNAMLKKKLVAMRKKAAPVAPTPIEQAIEGAWRIVSSKNMDEYLRARGAEVIRDMFFREAVHHYEIKDGVLKMHQSLGPTKFFKSNGRLDVNYSKDNVSIRSFILDNALFTIEQKKDDGADMGKEKRFVKDGRLHIVRARHGVECTRVYEKISE